MCDISLSGVLIAFIICLSPPSRCLKMQDEEQSKRVRTTGYLEKSCLSTFCIENFRSHKAAVLLERAGTDERTWNAQRLFRLSVGL
jgi:hypothetical protein